MTRWARTLGRMCQMVAQSRSMPGMRQTIEFIRSGGIGKVRLAHALCYKRRPSIGLVDTPAPLSPGLDFDLWAGPAPAVVPRRERLHYDWHWNRLTGNRDLGNHNPHELDKARWGLGKQTLPTRVVSVGGRLGSWSGGTDQLHYDNFLEAVRSRDRSRLHLDIEEGHLSSALTHLGNVSWALGEPVDPGTRQARGRRWPPRCRKWPRRSPLSLSICWPTPSTSRPRPSCSAASWRSIRPPSDRRIPRPTRCSPASIAGATDCRGPEPGPIVGRRFTAVPRGCESRTPATHGTWGSPSVTKSHAPCSDFPKGSVASVTSASRPSMAAGDGPRVRTDWEPSSEMSSVSRRPPCRASSRWRWPGDRFAVAHPRAAGRNIARGQDSAETPGRIGPAG